MDARVSGGTRWVGAHGVALHPLLAAAQPLEVEQGAANTFQSFHLSGKCSTNEIKPFVEKYKFASMKVIFKMHDIKDSAIITLIRRRKGNTNHIFFV